MEQGLLHNEVENLYQEVLALLKRLIETQSFSKEEDQTARMIGDFLEAKGVKYNREQNNIWAKNLYFDDAKPTILFNSHHDTVKPNLSYTNDPFKAIEKDGKLYGLGSNDAGGPLVSLIATFLYFYAQKDLKYNIILSATAEEEISGVNGVESILKHLGNLEFAIVGEPTEMQLAVAEKGLLVLDCIAKGTPSHAAHPNNDNAIYNAIEDIEWVRNYEFPKESPWLGKVKMTTTVINAGSLHNMVPDECRFTIDVRVTDQYTNQEVYETIKAHLKSEVKPRSLRLNSSSISEEHPIVRAGLELGRTCYGSPTSSDQAVIPFASLKLGPGLSTRSHSADEYIFLHEIKEGIELYIKILEKIIY
ncbi:acetylornithine deacetylase [Elizabethkingia miricola]|uniref:Acetylornithine deacetylase n=1 Tax=Elizabethkingia miricola TaxID=172045 RepID=A0ABY3NKU6_ELIMR|nr:MULTISPECIES: M20 family metallo-hydrolase [Elizabethkingia]OBS11685.1 acetylornithine deacetylase [Elizabethkingia miricola]TYO93486.1 acetylornithine deacetylase [Elizabethkingia miricola]